MLTNELHKNMLNSPVRTIKGRVSVYRDGALTRRLNSYDALKSIKTERLGNNSKFFGFGVMHKMNFKARDIEREIDIRAKDKAVIGFGVEDSFYEPFAPVYVTEVHRDETTNEMSVTAYDKLYNASGLLLKDTGLTAPYTIADVIDVCAAALGVGVAGDYVTGPYAWNYETGANFDEAATILDALVFIAEATQTIYYLDRNEKLVFKLLDVEGAAATTLTKEHYYTLTSKTNRRLSVITYATEIGENYTSGTGLSGSTQFIRDNPFFDLLDSTTIAERINGAIERIGSLTINQFDCSWRGNYLIEIGDKIDLITREGNPVCTYLLNDTIEYNGALVQKTEWSYENDESETAENPITITDKMNQTYAKVDKVNNRIDLVAGRITEGDNALYEEISQIQMTTGEIAASVSQLRETIDEGQNSLREEIDSVRESVEMKISSDEMTIAIQTELAKGVDKITTATGFKFDAEGLTIEKTGSEMSTIITEDGMTVRRGREDVLIANNEGVKAEDLHATTYLIIGKNSRFEDYKSGLQQRTGCFWIGG